MRLWVLVFLATLICSAQDAPHAQPSDFNPKLWLEDFDQIRSEMSAHYANLEWALEDRKMDLPQLRRDTEAKLREARDEITARRAIDKFLAAFGDGHLEIDWPKPNTTTGAISKPAESAPTNLCDHLGYKSRLHPGLVFAGLPEFSSVNSPEEKLFPGGTLRLQNHAVIGIIRIGLFSEHAFPEVCEQAVHDLHLAENAACDEKCETKLEIATANLLTGALVRRAEALAAAGATTLLIDITHNNGGSDWVEADPRALSSIPLRDSKMAFIKHEHWTKELQDRLRDVQSDIKNRASSPISLDAAARQLEKAIAASQQPCNRAAVWETGKLTCSLLVKNMLFTSGIVDYAKPGTLSSLESGYALFLPSQYAYSENPKALPLYVAIDRDAWSAAEYFAALLQNNHAATIIGEVSGGAGCGYTNDGIPAKLKNSGAELKMPDCVRYRPDSSNEVNGITPDVLVPWAAHDSDFQRMEKLFAVLKTLQTSMPQALSR